MKSICEFSRLVLWAILPALCPSVQADMGRAVVRHAPVLNGSVEGSLQQLLGESVVANGGATITGDLFVPGTPTVTLNGRPTYGGTVDGTGGESPSGYRITLNGTCSLRHVVAAPTPFRSPPWRLRRRRRERVRWSSTRVPRAPAIFRRCAT